MVFKNAVEALAAFGWGGENKKEDKNDEANKPDDLPAAGEDCESSGDIG